MDQDNFAAPPAPAKPARKRIAIFRREDREPLTTEIMPLEGVDAGVMAGIGKIMATGVPPGAGDEVNMLFREPGKTGLSLAHVWFKSGYILPRHTHSADCIYYVLGGELIMGATTIRKGEGIFLPAGAGYTYQAGPEGVEILEFRNATEFTLTFTHNDAAHWDRIAETMKSRAETWATEPAPYSA